MAQACDVNSLAALASPLQGLNGIELDVMIALLCIIANNGTGGGSGAAVLGGTGNPNTNSVSATAQYQFYIDTTNSPQINVWYATASGTGNWVEWIGN